MDVPKIPPRPKRSVDRSISPNRDTFARSPLNDPAFLHKNHHNDKGSRLSVELPPRPPSVTLPSLGQEGSEYASLEDLSRTLSRDDSGSPHQTKNIAGDLPLFAPRASVPSSTAKSRIQTVTRTDSSQAAAAGIGKLALPDDRSPMGPDSGRSDSSAGNRTRPASLYKAEGEEEKGIPEIGVQVPMYPDAGDVQAPTPSPYEQTISTGIGFHNKTPVASGRHHGRTKSGREIFHGPPGSYGMHGHGVVPKNDFEQQWYAKHPEDLAREQAGEYGPHIPVVRKDYHWVGDDLVKLVHSSASKGTGMGTSRDAIGTPDEQIGYLASEEYASRMASPKPQSGRPASIHGKNNVHIDSPLRHETDTTDEQTRTDDTEDMDVIHIAPPSHPASKVHGGGYDPPTEDLGPHGGNTEEEGGLITERGYGVPILASDEVEKHPEVEWRQPAVPPELERRASGEYTINEVDGTPQYISKPRTHSRSSSRNNNKISRLASPAEHYDRSGTPLESTKEYEPLFPEDSDEDKNKKPKTVAEKFKRPDLARHQFPSQDVWEDTPSSLQLETTVETPQGGDEGELYEEQKNPDAGTVFEDLTHEEQAQKDKEEEDDQRSFLPEKQTQRFANKHLNNVQEGGRPGMQHRFPSHDIWEDAPDHGQLITTVSTPQMEEDSSEYADASPIVEKPNQFLTNKPSIPARPQKESSPTDTKKAPSIPERPKPAIPSRPAKPLTTTRSSDKIPTLDAQGTGASQDAPAPKTKPAVPARPTGSKIAALQAGFLKDLNSKLGLGPQAPKPKEASPVEDEGEPEPVKPLADARKGRAKGPQRRKPASSSSPAPAATVTAEVAVPKEKLDFGVVTTVWCIDVNDGRVEVPADRMARGISAALAGKAKGEEQVEAADAKNVQVGDADASPSSKESTPEATPSSSSEEPLKATDSSQSERVETPAVETDVPGGFPLERSKDEDEDSKPNPSSSDAQDAGDAGDAEADTVDVGAGKADDELTREEALKGPTPSATKPGLPGASEVGTQEPLDDAVYEEGKDSERKEVGL